MELGRLEMPRARAAAPTVSRESAGEFEA
eukprot:COSAG02_NODE_19008_length_905_cov_2.935484_1_plen_28_part_01